MFRLAQRPFEESQEMKEIATYCVTKTIEHQLKNYFEAGWQKEPAETLYKKVKLKRVYELIPTELYLEMEGMDLNADVFLAKKVAQMMLELRSEEEITFDLFNEYLLAKMIASRRARGLSGLAPQVKKRLEELKQVVHDYTEKYMVEELELNEEEQEIYENEVVKSVTQFSFFGSEGELAGDCIFWDYDFALFDECGLKKALGFFAEPTAFYYGADYIGNIFHSVGESCLGV